MPFKASNTGALYSLIPSPEPVALPDQPAVSPQLADLLARLLDKNPATRIKLDEVGCGASFGARLRPTESAWLWQRRSAHCWCSCVLQPGAGDSAAEPG